MASQKDPNNRICTQEKPIWCSINRNPLRRNFFTDDLYMKIMKRESKKTFSYYLCEPNRLQPRI